jgi:hypothetical protein
MRVSLTSLFLSPCVFLVSVNRHLVLLAVAIVAVVIYHSSFLVASCSRSLAFMHACSHSFLSFSSPFVFFSPLPITIQFIFNAKFTHIQVLLKLKIKSHLHPPTQPYVYTSQSLVAAAAAAAAAAGGGENV